MEAGARGGSGGARDHFEFVALGEPRKMAMQIPKEYLAHQQVLAAIFGRTRLDKYPCMKDDWKLTFYASPWAKQ